ncbi:MAG: pseudaminic acid cytidylyltransferase [Flavobacteriaceae bacterium]|nr:MAG: pseudaminic acid cytidylyltransferase [Flavobacteriaceae bacterium]
MLAIIPARGGSKRIPRKNIRPFLGKPIIAYSIETAIQSNLFDEVMVSTDNEEIAKIAMAYGAKIPFLRSDDNSNDFATTADVLVEVIKKYKELGKEFTYCSCIYPTSPFITQELIKQSIEKLISGKFDCVFPILRYSFPIQRAMRIDKEHRIAMINSENMSKRSQDLIPSFHDAGQFYSFHISKFLEEKKLWTSNTSYIEISELEAQDIDNETDWKLAELKYKIKIDEDENII